MSGTLAAHQPAYLPWLGYFDKMLQSDTYVFLDSVQYEKNSFINRNRIKTAQGPIWLTVPVLSKGHLQATLAGTEMDNRQNWKTKHLKSIATHYRKAPRFEERFPKLEKVYQNATDLLSDFCYDFLMFWNAELGIKRKVVRAKDLDVAGTKSDLILNLCKMFRAERYLSGALGKDYLNERDFKEQGIAVAYQEYEHPIYGQLYGDFIPGLSVLDLWMNTDDFTPLLKGRT